MLSTVEPYLMLLRGGFSPVVALLTGVVIFLSLVLVATRRRSQAPRSVKGQPAASAVPLPGQKNLAERLRELDEQEDRHRRKVLAEIKTYEGPYAYDPTACASLEHFLPLKKATHCVFAPASRIWGSRDYDASVSIEENVKRSLPAFLRFVEEVQSKHIDGFLFEVPMQPKTLQEFATIVTRVMRTVSDYDPAYSRFMDNEFIGRRGWYPQVNRQPFFVTTFGTCYPTNHSRFTFGVNSCFVLFQPDVSFSRHNIEDNHPDDDKYDTVRQRIRNIFKANDRAYYIPPTRFSPLAEHVVAALNIHDKFSWWECGRLEHQQQAAFSQPKKDA